MVLPLKEVILPKVIINANARQSKRTNAACYSCSSSNRYSSDQHTRTDLYQFLPPSTANHSGRVPQELLDNTVS